jgi:hypothetical protein
MDWREHYSVSKQLLDLSNTFGASVASSERLAGRKRMIRMRVIGCRRDALDKLPNGHGGSASFTVSAASPTSRLFIGTTTRPELADYPHLPFRVESLGDPAAIVILGISTSKLWKEIVDRFVREAYPALFPVFLRQQDLKDVVAALEQGLRKDEELRLMRVSRQRRQLNGESRREYDSEVAWTDRKLDEVFSEATEQGLFLKRMSFRVCRQIPGRQPRDTDLEGIIGSNAEFAVTERASWMHSAGLQVALKAIRGATTLARDRARKPGQSVARTIIAQLVDETITQDKLRSVAARLRRMPKASVSIIHGNPYLHARVVDFNDGSAFELLLVSPSRFMLVPQLRATEGAVTRLCQYIYEHVGEAEFLDGTAT